jgi:hypothetical protein
MKNNKQNENLIAFCGLYCKNCSKYSKGSCPGCEKNEKASWCAIRSCCIEKNILSCAECTDFQHLSECKKYNNVFSKVIQFVTRTDREQCIQIIRKNGREAFMLQMDVLGKMSLPKQKN